MSTQKAQEAIAPFVLLDSQKKPVGCAYTHEQAADRALVLANKNIESIFISHTFAKQGHVDIYRIDPNAATVVPIHVREA